MGKNNTLIINANIEIEAESLQAIVENCKKRVDYNKSGRCKIDTADKVSEIISKFLLEKNFSSFAKDILNYK
jgi:hypothetical protein